MTTYPWLPLCLSAVAFSASWVAFLIALIALKNSEGVEAERRRLENLREDARRLAITRPLQETRRMMEVEP